MDAEFAEFFDHPVGAGAFGDGGGDGEANRGGPGGEELGDFDGYAGGGCGEDAGGGAVADGVEDFDFGIGAEAEDVAEVVGFGGAEGGLAGLGAGYQDSAG